MALAIRDRSETRPTTGAAEPRLGASGGATARRGQKRGVGWLLTREAIVHMLLVGAMIGIVWGSISVHLAQQRREVEIRAARDSSNLAHTAAESIGQTIAGVDDALRFIGAIFSSDPKHFDIAVWASRVNRTRGVALDFAIIGPDGKLGASSLGTANMPADFSERDFFKAHVGDTLDRLFISQPILGRTSGRWSVLFTRKVVAADGWFMGVMVASVDPLWLTNLHQTLDIGRGSLMLVGTDGFVRAVSIASSQDSTRGVGQDIRGSALLAAAAERDRGTVAWSNPVDGTRQTVSFQRLTGYSSIVAVSLNMDDVFAPHELYAQQYKIFGVCLTLLILVTGCLLVNNTRNLLVSRRILKDTMDAIGQGIVMIDSQGRIPVINRRATELLELAPHRASSRPPTTALADPHAREGHAGGHGPYSWHPATSEKYSSYEEVLDNGKILEIHTHPLDDGGAVRTYTDITERKNAEAQIIHLALHDALTGLPNRRMFADLLTDAIDMAKNGGKGCAVLWIDLDRFKYINDRHGHRFGDRVLLQVADRLRGVVTGTDSVARFGGDEFCILQREVGDRKAAEDLAQQVVARLSDPYEIDGHEVSLSASLGVALSPENGTAVDQLLTNADTALYRAKEQGRSTFKRYDPAMDVAIAERRLLEQDLRVALALEQLSVHYQPIFKGSTYEIAGFEALVRWLHPTRGNVSPDVFISIAEESSLIVELGQWVMETAFVEATRWPESIRISVNLSPKQFSVRDIAGRIASTLARTGLPAGRLTLEITEGVLIDNGDRALAAILALKALGIRITLDDFGTGYSSLSYLRRFPFDGIKIDKSFIMTLFEDEGSRTIVQAILALGRNLNLLVVAEGVENREQLDWLRATGNPNIQGFLLGRPMPPEAIEAFLEEAGGLVLQNH